MTEGNRPDRSPDPDLGPDRLLDLVTEGMRARVEPGPIDGDALLAGARAGATRIHRRRRLAAAAATIVVLSVPVSLLGRDLIGGAGSTITAGRAPRGTTPAGSSPAAPVVPPAVPGQAPPTPFVLRLGSATGGRAVTLTFTARTGPIAGTAAVTTRPVVTASGGDPGLRHQVQATLNERIALLTGTYRARLIGQGLAGRPMVQTIQVRGTVRWRHTVSVIFDVTQQDPDRQTTTTAAVVLDSRTGTAVAAQDLFTNVTAADAVMRAAVRAAAAPAPALDQALAALSMRPDRATDAFTWYPTPAGLRWVCASDTARAATGTGVQVTVAWSRLNRFLTATAR